MDRAGALGEKTSGLRALQLRSAGLADASPVPLPARPRDRDAHRRGGEKRRTARSLRLEINAIRSEVFSWLVPSFTSLRYGQPSYGQLRSSSPPQIRGGADDEAEMGVFHDLFQPQRETNLRVRLEEYLRFGLEAGNFLSDVTGRNFTQVIREAQSSLDSESEILSEILGELGRQNVRFCHQIVHSEGETMSGDYSRVRFDAKKRLQRRADAARPGAVGRRLERVGRAARPPTGAPRRWTSSAGASCRRKRRMASAFKSPPAS